EPVEPTRLLVADGAPVLPALGAEVPVFELPVLPLALPALFTEPVEPTRLLVADGAPVLVPLLPELLVEPETPPELPVLPFAAELPALLVEPVLPTLVELPVLPFAAE